MTVRLVGEGPAIEAAAAALADVDVPVERGDLAGLAGASLGIVCDTAGADTFEAATDATDHWIAVEVGGIGGVAVAGIDATISGFAPETGCYRCLARRVAANDPEPADGARADRSAVRLAGAIAGHEAVRVLAGEDGLSGRVIEVPRAEHEFLPVPNCECEPDDGASQALPIPREYEDRSLPETVARMDRAIDDRVGVVHQLGEAESFPAPYYLATLADTAGVSDGDAPEQAAGVADGWNAALAKGVGEALERYAAAIYREADLRRAPPATLDRAVPPATFAGAPDDAPGTDTDVSLAWVEAEALTAGGSSTSESADAAFDGAERTWVPAGAVHFPPPSDASLAGITTGLGLGSSPVDALRSGLTEVIERDATMLAWYSTFESLGLAVDDQDFERLARRARGEGLSVTPLLLTQDVDVPVVAVAVHREGDWPRFAVGSAAGLDPAGAARGALEEAIQNWMELRSVGVEDAPDLDGAIGEYAGFPEAARRFVDVETTVPAASVGPDQPPTGRAALDALVDAVAAAGLDAYAARLTTRDLAGIGFEVVRVLAPGAQPLFTGPARFGERAATVPSSLGFEPDLDREHHPYP